MYKYFMPFLLTSCVYAMEQRNRISKEDIGRTAEIVARVQESVLQKQIVPCITKKHIMFADRSFLNNLLINDGIELKKLLRIDSLGNCSELVKKAEALLYEFENTIDWRSYSPEVRAMAVAVSQRSVHRNNLIRALKHNQFSVAKTIIDQNPYVLYTYFGEYRNDLAGIVFIDKLLCCSNQYQYFLIQKLLHRGFDLNSIDTDSQTLLSKAVLIKEGIQKYKDVLRGGVSVNVRDKYGKSALSYAIQLRDYDKINMLLQYGAVVDDHIDGPLPVEITLFTLLRNAYHLQYCIICRKIPFDRSNIPCVNRHLGHFICKNCYIKNHRDNNACPLCRRQLDIYGM